MELQLFGALGFLFSANVVKCGALNCWTSQGSGTFAQNGKKEMYHLHVMKVLVCLDQMAPH